MEDTLIEVFWEQLEKDVVAYRNERIDNFIKELNSHLVNTSKAVQVVSPSLYLDEGKFYFSNLSGVTLEISQKNVKPLVWAIFDNNRGKVLNNTNIYEGLKSLGYIVREDIEYKKKWTMAISLSLNSLCNARRIIKLTGRAGRVKQYKLEA